MVVTGSPQVYKATGCNYPPTGEYLGEPSSLNQKRPLSSDKPMAQPHKKPGFGDAEPEAGLPSANIVPVIVKVYITLSEEVNIIAG